MRNQFKIGIRGGEIVCLLDDVLEYSNIMDNYHSPESVNIELERFRAFLKNTTDAVFCYEFLPPIKTTDTIEQQVRAMYDGVLVECNDICAKSYGANKAEDVIGKKLTELFGTEPHSLDNFFSSFIENDYKAIDLEGKEVLNNGDYRYYRNNAYGTIEDGNLVRVWGVFRDVTELSKSAEEMRSAMERYHTLSTATFEGIAITEAGIVKDCNAQMTELLGYTRDELVGIEVERLVDPDDTELVIQNIKAGAEGPYQHRALKKDGTSFYVEVRAKMMEIGGKQIRVTAIQDISARVLLEQAVRDSEEKYRSLVENVNFGIYRTSSREGGKFIQANPALARMFGFSSPAELMDVSPRSLYADPRDRKAYLIELQTRGTVTNKEIRLKRKDGTAFWAKINTNATLDNNGEIEWMDGVIEDISEKKAFEEQLKHDAFHDSLTNLPNRSLFVDRLHHVIQRSERNPDYLFAIMFLDLDHFKLVNDNFGHETGDSILVEVAKRISNAVRSMDTVARFAGDEFTILLEEIDRVEQAMAVAERILQLISRPISFGSNNIVLTASIGVVIRPETLTTASDLLKDADIAMYEAKQSGKNNYTLLDSGILEHAREQIRLQSEIRTGISEGQFRTHFQPIHDLTSGGIAGFEALARWRHPKDDLLYPEKFIHISEETGSIIQIGYEVINHAISFLVKCSEEAVLPDNFFVSINLARRQLLDPDFANNFGAMVKTSKIKPERIKLEITESTFMELPERVGESCKRLASFGFDLFLDDFGTGFSSLWVLHQLPIQAIKVDKSFINGIEGKGKTGSLTKSIFLLADELHIHSIAEGIEKRSQLKKLKELGCTYGQGYLFEKPLNTTNAQNYLKKQVA